MREKSGVEEVVVVVECDPPPQETRSSSSNIQPAIASFIRAALGHCALRMLDESMDVESELLNKMGPLTARIVATPSRMRLGDRELIEADG